MSKGKILELQAEEFSKRTVPEVLAMGYGMQQIPYIREELAKLGLSFKDDVPVSDKPEAADAPGAPINKVGEIIADGQTHEASLGDTQPLAPILKDGQLT
jgi:hypothetical protein